MPFVPGANAGACKRHLLWYLSAAERLFPQKKQILIFIIVTVTTITITVVVVVTIILCKLHGRPSCGDEFSWRDSGCTKLHCENIFVSMSFVNPCPSNQLYQQCPTFFASAKESNSKCVPSPLP